MRARGRRLRSEVAYYDSQGTAGQAGCQRGIRKESREIETDWSQAVGSSQLQGLVGLLVVAFEVIRLGRQVAKRFGQAEREVALSRLELVRRCRRAVLLARRRSEHVGWEEDDELAYDHQVNTETRYSSRRNAPEGPKVAPPRRGGGTLTLLRKMSAGKVPRPVPSSASSASSSSSSSTRSTERSPHRYLSACSSEGRPRSARKDIRRRTPWRRLARCFSVISWLRSSSMAGGLVAG